MARKKTAHKRTQRKATEPRLSDTHLAFAEILLADPNRCAARAYRRLHDVTPASARELGKRTLHRDDVQRYLERRRAEIAERLGVTAARVIAELAAIAFARPRHVVEWGPDGVRVLDCNEVPDEIAGAISEISEGADGQVRVQFHNKTEALRLLAASLDLDLATTKTEVTVNVAAIAQMTPAEAQSAYREFMRRL